MTSPPMRPVQNALVILALFLVAGALLPWGASLRLMCAGAAIAIVLLLFVTRLRAHGAGASPAAVSDTQDRIERIRAARAARMGRRR